MLKRIVLLLLILGSQRLGAVNYFWVGGTGNWSDVNNWATTSGGGSKHAQVPTPDDDVYFDASSFGANGQSMTINVSNAVCRDFIWTGVKFKPRFMITDPTYALRIYGSLKLSSAMNFAYTGYFVFEATTTGKTITTANFNIQKMEFRGIGGEWTLQDSLKLTGDPNGVGINLISGHLITNDKALVVKSFYSAGNNVRTLSLGNSIVNLRDNEGLWRVENTNFYLNAGNSQIHLWYKGWRKQFYHFAQQPKSRFNNIYFHDKYTSDAIIGDYFTVTDSTSINLLYFESVVNGIEVSGANIKRLVFKERVDNINLNTAKIKTLQFYDDSRIQGSGNFDSLFFALGKNYKLAVGATQAVGIYWGLAGTCNGFIRIQSDDPGKQTTFSKLSGTVVGSNLILQDIAVGGGASFTANSSINLGNNTGWTVNSAASRTLYYIGKKGNWSNSNSWSLTSGGSAVVCIPSPLDNVIFDSKSFSSTSDTLFLDQTYSRCQNMTWQNSVTNNTIYSSQFNALQIFGNISMQNISINAMSGNIYFESPTLGKTLTSNGFKFTRVEFANMGGWVVQDSLHAIGFQTNFYGEAIMLKCGTLNCNGKPISARRFTSYGQSYKKLILGNSLVTIYKSMEPAWYVEGSNFNLDAGTSEIQIWRSDWRKTFYHFSRAPKVNYNKIKFMDLVQNTQGTDDFRVVDSVTINYLYFKSYLGYADFNGARVKELFCEEKVVQQNSNLTTFGKATYSKDVTMYGDGTFDTLVLSPGSINKLEQNRTQTINKKLSIRGNCKGLISIESTEAGKQASINKALDSANGEYLSIRDINAIGGAIYTANKSKDRGNNNGWKITALVGSTYYWVADSGSWSDPNHWSLTSGGSPSGCVPGELDDVVFDFNSFFKSGFFVNIDIGNASCRNMTWTSSVRSAILKGPEINKLHIYGDLKFRQNLDYKFEGVVSMDAEDTGNAIFPYYKPIRRLEFNGTGSWRLFDSLQVIGDRNGEGMFLNNGHLMTQSNYLNVRRFFSTGNNYRALTLDNSQFDILNPNDWGWWVEGTKFILSADKSTINVIRKDWRKCFNHQVTSPRSKFNKIRFQYKCTNPSGTDYFKCADSTTINELILESYVQELTIPSCYIGHLECKEKVNFEHGENPYTHIAGMSRIRYAKYFNECDFYGKSQYDTLVLNPGGIYKFQNAKAFTVSKLLDAVGNSCFSITLQSTLTNYPDTIVLPTTATVLIDYVEMRDQLAKAASVVKVGSFSSNVSGNSNWLFQSSNNVRFGLGPDTVLCVGDTLQLRTDFYKGAISYKWNDGSSRSTLTVKKGGVYWVKVTFTYRNDTCWKFDTIRVDYTPISLKFTQKHASCDVAKDGWIKVNFNGLYPKVSWKWNHGPTADSIWGVGKGKYTVTVTDVKGCKLTDTVSLMNDTFKVATQKIDSSYCAYSLKSLGLFNRDSAIYKMNWYSSTGTLIKTSNNFFKKDIKDSLILKRSFVNNQGCVGPMSKVRILGRVLGDSIKVTEYKARCITSSNGALKAQYLGAKSIYWSWSQGGISDSISGLMPGVYYVAATDKDGCILNDSGNIGYEIVPKPRLIDTAVCYLDSALLGQKKLPGYRLEWFDKSLKYLDSNNSRKVFVNTDSVVFWVQNVSYTGCKSALVKNKVLGIQLPKSPNYNGSNDLCLNVKLDSLSVSGNRIKWYPTSKSKIWTSKSPVPDVSKLGKQVYYFTQTIGFCTSLMDSVVINVGSSKVYASADTTIYIGSGCYLGSWGTPRVVWYPKDLVNDSNSYNPYIKPNTDTCFVVIGYSKEGCKSRDTVCVQVIDLFDLILPNIITPNGDSENDIWDASVLPDFYKFTLQVYDRQGLSVNVMKQYQNNFHGQDFDGNDLPVGIYYYRFFNPENEMEFKGYIQIIRYF